MKCKNLKKGKGQPEHVIFDSSDKAIQTAVYQYNNHCVTFELTGWELEIDKDTGKATGAKKSKSKDDKKETWN